MYYGIPLRISRLAHFYAQFIRPGDLCFDIGAHVGNHIAAWTRLDARVVAVEPQPRLMAWLRQRYGRQSHITLVEAAVGAQPGAEVMYVSRRTPTVTTLSREWMAAVKRDSSFAGVAWDEAVAVAVTTLDALIGRFGEPAFCKIDVEGYELEVLRGLSLPIRALTFEYIAATMDTAVACIERLAQLGCYEFNWSVGESHRLQSANWLNSNEMIAQLQSLPYGSRSGNVCGRLREIGD